MDSNKCRWFVLLSFIIYQVIYGVVMKGYSRQIMKFAVAPHAMVDRDNYDPCGAYNKSWEKLFDFVPRRQDKVINCHKLLAPFTDAIAKLHRDMGDLDYQDRWHDFSLQVNKSKVRHKECYSGELLQQSSMFHRLVQSPFVKTVCETGFNAGSSAFVWLAANPGLHVYSFDLGRWNYSRPMAEYLTKTFHGRLTVSWGNPMKTLRRFANHNPSVKCDVISINGGNNFEVIQSNFRTFQTMANFPNVLLLDYCRTGMTSTDPIGELWKAARRAKQVDEFLKCTHLPKAMRGLTIGKYMNTNCDT